MFPVMITLYLLAFPGVGTLIVSVWILLKKTLNLQQECHFIMIYSYSCVFESTVIEKEGNYNTDATYMDALLMFSNWWKQPCI